MGYAIDTGLFVLWKARMTVRTQKKTTHLHYDEQLHIIYVLCIVCGSHMSERKRTKRRRRQKNRVDKTLVASVNRHRKFVWAHRAISIMTSMQSSRFIVSCLQFKIGYEIHNGESISRPQNGCTWCFSVSKEMRHEEREKWREREAQNVSLPPFYMDFATHHSILNLVSLSSSHSVFSLSLSI